MTEYQVRLLIFKLLRPIIRAPDISGRLTGNENEDEILAREYQHFFEGENSEIPIYEIQILNNLRNEPGVFYNSKMKCEFCDTDHSGNCKFTFSDKAKNMQEFVRLAQNARPGIALVINWRAQNPLANLVLLEKPQIIKIDMRNT